MAPAAAAQAGGPAPRRRVFFALWPDAATRKAIVRATREAVRRSGGRAVPEANLHVTLAFLGPITPEDLDRVLAIEPPNSLPFELRLERLGFWDGSRVLWIGATETPPALLELERALWDALVALGFTRERRIYRPHLTVARKAQAARGEAAAVTWPVSGIALVESRPSPRSARYEVLRKWAFA
jgi:2'-5' RNA ligase